MDKLKNKEEMKKNKEDLINNFSFKLVLKKPILCSFVKLRMGFDFRCLRKSLEEFSNTQKNKECCKLFDPNELNESDVFYTSNFFPLFLQSLETIEIDSSENEKIINASGILLFKDHFPIIYLENTEKKNMDILNNFRK